MVLLTGRDFKTFCQAQPKPQLSWTEWLYFQLIQPPGKVYFPAGANLESKVEQSRKPQHKQATQKLVGSYLKLF